ncbi:MAG TPA: hypothetical protein VNJ02_10860 [Vicinamibacterales bacterium]|nr:hypothetical protein [Vicinamibacterales bacterium]
MALILAIEPDPQQAALLTDLVRTRVRSDLVLADTTEHALVAIADRVPDLVLIPALMSAQEDAALAGALRMIAAAARVEMVTIPFLAAPVPSAEPRGVLGKWRRSRKSETRLVGCDPAVFADQIAAYLPDEQGSGIRDQGSDATETETETETGIWDLGSGTSDQGAEVEEQASGVSHQAEPAPAAIADAPIVVDEPNVVAERIELAVEPVREAAPIVNDEPVPPVANPVWSPRRSFALIDWQAETPHEPVAQAPPLVDAAPVVAHAEEAPITRPVAEPPAIMADVDDAAVPLRVDAAPQLDAPAAALFAIDEPEEVVAAMPAIELEKARLEQPVEAATSAPMVEEPPAPIALSAIDEPQLVAAVPQVDEARQLLALREAELERREAELRLREEAMRLRDEAPALIEQPVVAPVTVAPVVAAVPAVHRQPVVVTAPEIIVTATEPEDDSFYELSFDELEADAALVSMMAPQTRPQTSVRPQAPALRTQDPVVRPAPIALPEIEDPLFFFDPAPSAPARAQAPALSPMASAAPARAARPEWAELIDSLRQDIERLKSERVAPAHSNIVDYDTPAPSRASLTAASATHSTVTIQSRKMKAAKPAGKRTARPVQDEWGLFDPEQCGFASLLAKLSEITDANESGASSRQLGR